MGALGSARATYVAGGVGLTIVVAFAFATYHGVAGSVVYLAGATYGTVLACVGASRLPRSQRLVWWGLAASLLLFLLGDVLWIVSDDVLHIDPFPSAADAVYLVFYLVLALAVAALVRARRRGRDRAALLDAAILTTGVAVVTTVFLIEPAAEAAGTSNLQQVIAAAYPVGDLLVLAVVVRLFSARIARNVAFWALLSGIAILLVGDLVYVAAVVYADLYPEWIDVGYLLSYLLLGLAVLHPSARELCEPAPERSGRRPTAARLVVLCGALVLAPVADQVAHLADVHHGSWVVLAGGCVSAVLVVLRLGDLLLESQRTAVQLAALSGKDELTGISNRTTWDHELSRACAIARADGMPLSVAVLDMDHFKQFNHEEGHLKGDLVLKETVAAWSDLLQGVGTLARIKGEEFAVLAPDMLAAQVVSVLDPMRRAVTHGQTCSVGVATWDGRETPAELLARADRALFLAKQSGRNRIAVDDGLAPSVVDRIEPGALLSSLRPVYQPIVKLRSGDVVGHEALSRFDGMEAREAFDRAARNGTSALLEAAAVRVALAGWDGDGLLALNASPCALTSHHFREVLPADLTGLIIEITEQALDGNAVEVMMAVEDLRERGALIAIDDYGAGFSNLARIAALRPDIIKLDISVIRGVHADETQQAIVAAALHFSKLTDGRVFAEGIESVEDRDRLVGLGVVFGQGNLLGAAAPLATH